MNPITARRLERQGRRHSVGGSAEPIDTGNIVEQVIAGLILIAAGAMGALLYDRMHK